MEPLFVARLILRAWLLPPTFPLLVALAGLLLARRRPRLGLPIAALGVLTVVALALPVIADPLQRAAESHPALDLTRPADAGAVVVLAGGVRAGPRRDRPDEPTALTLERLAHGVEVARATGLPLLLSGGSVFGTGAAEAVTMQHALRRYFDYPARWLETRSRNTEENARYSAELLRELGIRRVVLVTSAVHMRRSVAQFEAAGLEVVPAPAGGTATRYGGWADWLPSIGSLQRSCYAVYELLGTLVTVPRPAEAGVR